eukprot:1158274-Pelagomonas_calceolata.AAC.35
MTAPQFLFKCYPMLLLAVLAGKNNNEGSHWSTGALGINSNSPLGPKMNAGGVMNAWALPRPQKCRPAAA